jgi:hypothetical protein
VLVAAACLHDLGYAPALIETGFHGLDGARHLRALGYERLAGLVAYHSGARGEAEVITYEERLAGVEERYGAEHVVARSVRQARSEVERSTAFV